MNKEKVIIVTFCTIAIFFAGAVKLLPTIYYNLGQKDFKQQQYIKAYKNFQKAYKLNDQNKDYRYFYVQTLSKLQPTLKVQKEVFALASSKEKDSAQQVAESLVSKWHDNIIQNIGNNYIEQTPINNKIIRWDKFPLKVSIEINDNVPSYYRESIFKALEEWQRSVPFVKFTIQNTPKNSEITIKIDPMPNDMCSGDNCQFIAGFTTPDYKNNHLKKMDIVLYSKDPKGNFFSDKEVYNTTIHELGHALGIMGHSYSIGDLMYMSGSFYTPANTSFQYLSSKDINTIKLLYKLIPDITNNPNLDTKGLIYAPVVLGTSEQISKRKLEEAKNYIKNAPELAGGYIDLGIAYSELNKNEEAIKAMETAYKLSKTDEEKFMSLFNLAIIHLADKNTNKALEYAQQAQSISDTEDVRELITNINHFKNK